MLSTKLIKENLNHVVEKLKQRGFDFNVKEFNKLETLRKELQIIVEKLQSERNNSAKLIGQAKAKGEDIKPLVDRVANLKNKLLQSNNKLKDIQDQLNLLLSTVPNLPDNSIPVGKTEADNIELRRVGTPKKFDFTPQSHTDLGVNLGLDFGTASKITGSRFAVMHGKIALLHRILIQFMLDVHIKEHNFQEVYVPYLVNADSLFGTGQLPKFKKDLFSIILDDTLSEDQDEKELFLIPTAEVPVSNIYRDIILNENDLPIKHVSHTPCFRSEAGSYGKDTKGLIRQHQFEKVEMVQFVKPDESDMMLEQLTNYAEIILQKLALPYRVVSLCTADIGFSSAKTYDLEVWLPSQNTYREISSCSNFKDFQTRRMKTRYRNLDTQKTELLHSLNGSGLAVGRTLVAIMENYQNADGSINIPDILQPYMDGLTIIN